MQCKRMRGEYPIYSVPYEDLIMYSKKAFIVDCADSKSNHNLSFIGILIGWLRDLISQIYVFFQDFARSPLMVGFDLFEAQCKLGFDMEILVSSFLVGYHNVLINWTFVILSPQCKFGDFSSFSTPNCHCLHPLAKKNIHTHLYGLENILI